MNEDISKFIEKAKSEFSEDEMKEVRRILELATMGQFPKSDDVIKALEIKVKNFERRFEDYKEGIIPQLRRLV